MLGGNKLTSDRGEELKFWVHKQLAREFFHEASILFNDSFDAVDWKMVSKALREVPLLHRKYHGRMQLPGRVAQLNGNTPHLPGGQRTIHGPARQHPNILRLQWSTFQGATPFTVPDPFQMQPLGHTEKYHGQL